MDKEMVINELKEDIKGLLKIKEQLALQYGSTHENVRLIEKSIEAMKTEALTKLSIDALQETVKNSIGFEDAFDAEELIDFLENIFDEEARTFSNEDCFFYLDEVERDM